MLPIDFVISSKFGEAPSSAASAAADLPHRFCFGGRREDGEIKTATLASGIPDGQGPGAAARKAARARLPSSHARASPSLCSAEASWVWASGQGDLTQRLSGCRRADESSLGPAFGLLFAEKNPPLFSLVFFPCLLHRGLDCGPESNALNSATIARRSRKKLRALFCLCPRGERERENLFSL